MGYFKVVLSGHIVEVYEYEREPYVPGKKETDALTEYLLTGDASVIEREEDRRALLKKLLTKEEYTRHNGRAARANFRRLVLANFTGNTNFITLTFAENLTDVKEANKHFDRFMKRLRRKYGPDFKFTVVVEFQERGAVHYHMLADLGLTWSTEEECKEMERWFAKELWTHGFVDLKDVQHVTNLGAYMSKYMTKRLDDERLAGKKAYRTSQNMNRPVVLKAEEAKEIMQMYKLKQKTETYANSYESEYLGTITYTEYNLHTIQNKQL